VARADPKVVAAFKEKAGITDRAVRFRRDKLLELVPGQIDTATNAAAHQAGVKLDKLISPEKVQDAAQYLRLLQQAGAPSPAAPQVASTPKRTAKGKVRDDFKLPNVTVPPGTLSARAVADAKRMAERAYPVLYVFENSVREFVDGHLRAEYGKDWWDRPKLVAKGPRESYERNKRAQGNNRWVERKNAHPIYYTELGHLADIVTSEDGWKVFKPILNDQAWVRQHVRAFEVPRNIVSHMNPVINNTIKGLEVRAQEWFDQIKDHPPPG
jgi:Swt1-like HEPN